MPMAHLDLRPTGWFGRVLLRRPGRSVPPPSATPPAVTVDSGAAVPFESLAADIVHELRNPLGALSGEIELALRRERTPTEYRAALARMEQQVIELVALASDIGLIADPGQSYVLAVTPFPASELLAGIKGLAIPAEWLTVEDSERGVHLLGDPRRLARALALLAVHAVRHRSPGARVRVRLLPETGSDSWARVVLDAGGSGFVPHAWRHLAKRPALTHDETAGQLRPRMACRLVERCGGSVSLVREGGAETIQVRLRRVPETTRSHQ
jgi:signal transduction histidine kinase